jgi:glycine dehydrogenase subunit 2
MIREPLIFEISAQGKTAFPLPKLDVPEKRDVLGGLPVRDDIVGFPEVSEIEVVRHFTRLSQANYCIDTTFYPLGSCTMKYNPKINEKIVLLPGFLGSHPQAPVELVQGNLEILMTLADGLTEITGMDAYTLQPSAGAQGELVGMMLIRACLEDSGDPRRIVLIPDSAHGTNPSSAHICGYRVQEIKSNDRGTVDLASLKQNMTSDVAALMITNPNTLGVFEPDILQIAEIVHSKGGLLYMDGANMNALVGKFRPGDMGVDVIHLNLHKTFSTPHGGGGPGAGPVGVNYRKNSLRLGPQLRPAEVDRPGAQFLWELPGPDQSAGLHSIPGCSRAQGDRRDRRPQFQLYPPQPGRHLSLEICFPDAA